MIINRDQVTKELNRYLNGDVTKDELADIFDCHIVSDEDDIDPENEKSISEVLHKISEEDISEKVILIITKLLVSDDVDDVLFKKMDIAFHSEEIIEMLEKIRLRIIQIDQLDEFLSKHDLDKNYLNILSAITGKNIKS